MELFEKMFESKKAEMSAVAGSCAMDQELRLVKLTDHIEAYLTIFKCQHTTSYRIGGF